MFIIQLSLTARRWKQPKYPSTDDWNAENVMHSDSEILFSQKGTKYWQQTTTWRNLENMLSERTDTKSHVCTARCGGSDL
jgi:hypothetical protein